MKRLLLLLLLATSLGTLGQKIAPTKLLITNNISSPNATRVNVQENNGEVNYISKADLVDVLEYTAAVNLPTVGSTGKIYMTTTDNKLYRWNGTIYQPLVVVDISGKVDKVTGKSLILDTEISRLAGVTNFDNSGNVTALGNKVDKVTGKSLVSDTEITRLAGITNFDNSGNITALGTKVDKVTGQSLISDSEITRLAGVTNYTHPTNHPPSIITQDASNRFVSDTEKETWNSKQPALGFTPENVANKSDSFTSSSSTTYASTKALVDGLATKLTGTGTSSGTNTGDETTSTIQSKRPLKTIENQSLEGAGNIDLTKLDVGLANVDNTSDLSKPIATATQNALNLKANLASPTFTGTVVGITKSMVGLSTVDNTSDVNKPVSTAQQTALNLKENLSNKQNSLTADGTNTKYPTVTAVNAGLASKENTIPTGTAAQYIKGDKTLGTFPANSNLQSVLDAGGTYTTTSTGDNVIMNNTIGVNKKLSFGPYNGITLGEFDGISTFIQLKADNIRFGNATKYSLLQMDATQANGTIALTLPKIAGTIALKSDIPTAQDLSTYAPLESPALTGIPTAPTATVGTNTTQVATTAFVLANAGTSVGTGRTFYVSNSGNDSNNGLSQNTPFLTVTKVNTLTLLPGDKVLFMKDNTFTNSLLIKDSGTLIAPIYIGSYGAGKNPIIVPSNTEAAIKVLNSSYVTLENLDTVEDDRVTEFGIMLAVTSATSNNIKVLSCNASGFKSAGFYGYSDNATFGYSDVRVIGGNYFNNGTGVSMDNWTTTKNLNNILFKGIKAYNNEGDFTLTTSNSGNGIVLGCAVNSLIEECEAYGNGQRNNFTGGPVGIWVWECTNTTIRKSESHHNKTGSREIDGGGFDIDGGSVNCVIEYCYSHDNDGIGYGIFQYDGASQISNNIVRYNLSVNDSRRLLQDGGSLGVWAGASNSTGTQIFHNNTVYVSRKNSVKATNAGISFSGSQLAGVQFRNNIFYLDGVGTVTSSGTKYGTFSNNIVYGVNGATTDATVGTVTDPRFADPGFSQSIGIANFPLQDQLDAYKVQSNSPAVNAGFTFSLPTKDFFFNNILSTRDIGFHDFQGTPNVVNYQSALVADKFIKTGGTSTQFLKADGSVDATVYANLNTPALTGTPTAPTATAGTNTTQIATTAFVLANSLIPHLEFNNTEKTVWNNGNNNLLTNTSFGEEALISTTGDISSAFGYRALKANTSGVRNSAFGANSLLGNTTGQNNTAIGQFSLFRSITGDENTAVGGGSLAWITSGSQNIGMGREAGMGVANTQITTLNQGVYLGAFSQALATNQTNEIVIGAFANGAGSNTVTLGNDNITKTILKGKIALPTIPTTVTGTPDLLTRNATSGEIERVAYPSGGGGATPNLQSVLDAGSTANADSNQARVNLFEGPLGSKYHQLLINYGGNFSELRLTDNTATLSSATPTGQQTDIQSTNGLFSVYQSNPANGFRTVVTIKDALADTDISFPSPPVPGNYTLATTADVAAASGGGGTTPNLQDVLSISNGLNAELVSPDTFSSAGAYFQAANGISNSAIFSNGPTYNSTIQSANGIVDIVQQNTTSTNATTLRFLDPTVSTTINLPAPPVVGNYTLATTLDIPLSAVNEGNGVGYRLSSANPLNFGNIGADAIDLSYSETAGNFGATGSSSFAMGSDVKARNLFTSVFGYLVDGNGSGSFLNGYNLKDNGYTNSVFGTGHDVTSMNTTVVGQAANIINQNTTDYNAFPKRPLFVVGNGNINNADANYGVASRSDALVVVKDGSVTLPSTTNTLIDADTTGKIAVTKEWVTATVPKVIQIACSDLVTNITTGITKGYFRMPYSMTVTDVRVSLLNAGTTTGLSVDIKKNGTSVFGTLLSTDATEKTSTTASVPYTLATTVLENDSEIIVDFTGVPTGGKGVILTIKGI